MDILGSALHFRAAPLVAVLAADGLLAGMLRSTDSYLADQASSCMLHNRWLNAGFRCPGQKSEFRNACVCMPEHSGCRLLCSSPATCIARPALQRDTLTLKAVEAIALLCNAGIQLAEISSTTAEGSDGSSGAGASGGSDTSAKQLFGTIGQQASALKAAFQDAGLGELLQGQQPPTPVQPAAALRLCASSLHLAAALLEWWQRPEQAAASQLALAQMAAARSCACLGCDNLEHGLGPAAVKGEGRLKCR